MSKRTASAITLTLLLMGMLTLAFNIQQVKAELSSISTPLLWSYEIEVQNEEIACVAISDDGNYVAMGTQPYWVESGVYLFGKESNIPLWKCPVDGVWSVAISADGSYIAVGANPQGLNPKIYLFSKSSSTPLWSYSTDDIPWSIAISDDGNYIVAAELAGLVGEARKAYLFHKSSSTPLWTSTIVGAHGWPGTYELDISENGSYLTISDLPGLGFFHKSSNIPLWTSNVSVRSVTMSDDGTYVAAGGSRQLKPGTTSYAHELYLLHRSSDIPLWTYSAESWIDSVAISGDGNYIVATERGARALLFHKDRNTTLWSFEKHYEWTIASFSSISISDDGNHIVATEEGKLYLFSRESNEPMWTYDAELDLACISGNGNYIAAAGKRTLSLFDVSFQVPSEVWVDDDYTPEGLNDGHTWRYEAFDKIQDGVDALWGGGTVHVAPGTYYETAVYREYHGVTLGYVAIFISRDNVKLMGEGMDTTIIDSDRDATRVFVRGNDCAISGFAVQNSGMWQSGVFLWQYGGNTVTNNNISINYYGVQFSASGNNTLINNVIKSNNEGISVSYSDDNKILNNTVNLNHAGIGLESSGSNVIMDNNVSNNEYGIRGRGGSSNNIIYHNSFVENTEQVSGVWGTDAWDNGYPSGGNYWSDYEERYPNATEIDDSGIWSTAYAIDENNLDNYPLMEPWSPPSSIVGDLNNDGIVNLSDIATAGKAFGSYLGSPRWDSTADMNNDDVVNIFDLVLIARNFGKTA